MIKKEILITEDNLELRIKEFLSSLKEDYFKFNMEWSEEFTDWNKIIKNKKEVGFIPEKVLLRSPITILNAPWGTGKTHFIETMGKMIIQGKITEEELSHTKNNEFKFKISNFIIIDMWKICNYENAVEQIFKQIISKILPLDEDDLMKEISEKKWPKIKNWFWALPSLIKGNIGFSDEGWKSTFELDIMNFSQTRDKLSETQMQNDLNEVKDIVNILVENHLKKDSKEKTLIFFDNIERLGPFAWEVIKIIQKLQELNNLIIIFAMNKNGLVNQTNTATKDKYFESHMEKYLNMDYYNLQQDYLGVLSKSKIKSENLIILDEFFNHEMLGKKKSIREMKKIIENDVVISNFSKNQIFGLKSIIGIISWNDMSVEMNSETSRYLEQFIIGKFGDFLLFINKLENWQKNMFEHDVWKKVKFTQQKEDNPYSHNRRYDIYYNSYIQLHKSSQDIFKNIKHLNSSNNLNMKLLKYVIFDWIELFKSTENLLDLQLKNCLTLFEKINIIALEITEINLEIDIYKKSIFNKNEKINDFKQLQSPTENEIYENSINKNTIESTQKIIFDKSNLSQQKNQQIKNIQTELLTMCLFWSSFKNEWTKELFEKEFLNNVNELKTFFSYEKTEYLKIFENLNNEDKLIFDILKNHEENLKDIIIDDSFINSKWFGGDGNKFKNIFEFFDIEFEKYEKNLSF